MTIARIRICTTELFLLNVFCESYNSQLFVLFLIDVKKFKVTPYLYSVDFLIFCEESMVSYTKCYDKGDF